MRQEIKRVAVIGGGAAGFFAAISAKTNHPNAEVIIFEKTSKVLAKVKVSGGGRCNVTHNETEIKRLIKNYPRGEKFLRKAFYQFAVSDTIAWFEDRNVSLKVEPDNRMFPVSNTSQTIIDTLQREVEKLGIHLKMGTGMRSISKASTGLNVFLTNEENSIFDAVIVCLGGQKNEDKYAVFKELGHTIQPPVPSLFTFNITNSKIIELMGTVCPLAQVKIQGTKFQNTGPLLVTHWGMSGPAILKLSAMAARELAARDYQFKIQVNWLGETKEEEVRNILARFVTDNGKKQVNKNPVDIPNRLWAFFITELSLDEKMTWNSVDKKSKNRIVNKLVNDEFEIHKKTTFKEEFVICGGISLTNIDPQTMQSKVTPNLYFAGEFMDIDGVTGGFNFQAAWTTGFISGKLA
ncbi:MAG: putative Rossmann fold flavoprotein [Salibacteraceae bacterium]|jgi:predicted Rossmann fold flavoprotein